MYSLVFYQLMYRFDYLFIIGEDYILFFGGLLLFDVVQLKLNRCCCLSLKFNFLFDKLLIRFFFKDFSGFLRL